MTARTSPSTTRRFILSKGVLVVAAEQPGGRRQLLRERRWRLLHSRKNNPERPPGRLSQR